MTGRENPQDSGSSSRDTVHGVVCGECGRGEWFDYEHGDSIKKCPFCESQNATLVELEDYHGE